MPISSPLFNCQQATLLIERRADEALPLKTQVQLWAHLRLCPLCRRYAVQSVFIARQAQAAVDYRVPADVVLPAAARQRIQQALDQHSAE
ncbi:hypothetical protein LJ737_21070 [Hymenobacter sp. 15J16-1T3B]|uniref:hypothetical protein n=1 Tax=Hymenobacter sp. 15J16-1T3B TaxID=2886941 RepID=UPI001D1225C0|nr:hypothetical protein [Hymenobacter sp. 15J16-1T3B]MCC3159746.1 hypothetical protein [Hymenobacter sp. 15J16-1T3B]